MRRLVALRIGLVLLHVAARAHAATIVVCHTHRGAEEDALGRGRLNVRIVSLVVRPSAVRARALVFGVLGPLLAAWCLHSHEARAWELDVRAPLSVGGGWSTRKHVADGGGDFRLNLDVSFSRVLSVEGALSFGGYGLADETSRWFVGGGGGISLRPRPHGPLVVIDEMLGRSDFESSGHAFASETRITVFPIYASIAEIVEMTPAQRFHALLELYRPSVWISERYERPLGVTYSLGVGFDLAGCFS